MPNQNSELMRLLLNERFTAYHHVLECLLQTLHGPNAHIGSAGNEPTHVEYTTADDETSVGILSDFALKLNEMVAPNPESVNHLIHGALEFPRNTPCVFPIEVLYKAVIGNEWLTRAVAELAKNDPTSRRLAGCLVRVGNRTTTPNRQLGERSGNNRATPQGSRNRENEQFPRRRFRKGQRQNHKSRQSNAVSVRTAHPQSIGTSECNRTNPIRNRNLDRNRFGSKRHTKKRIVSIRSPAA